MADSDLNIFLELIQSQFRDDDRLKITLDTDLKTLKEWSSLQTMIIVNEIDKAYDVILDFQDMKRANSVTELFNIIQSKKE